MVGPEIIDEVWGVISDRAENPVEGSYTTHILSHRKGIDKPLEKVGEEATEFILAIKNGDSQAIAGEAADLVFHMLLSLKAARVDLSALYAELELRRK